jgi:hypothetical protein
MRMHPDRLTGADPFRNHVGQARTSKRPAEMCKKPHLISPPIGILRPGYLIALSLQFGQCAVLWLPHHGVGWRSTVGPESQADDDTVMEQMAQEPASLLHEMGTSADPYASCLHSPPAEQAGVSHRSSRPQQVRPGSRVEKPLET